MSGFLKVPISYPRVNLLLRTDAHYSSTRTYGQHPTRLHPKSPSPAVEGSALLGSAESGPIRTASGRRNCVSGHHGVRPGRSRMARHFRGYTIRGVLLTVSDDDDDEE